MEHKDKFISSVMRIDENIKLVHSSGDLVMFNYRNKDHVFRIDENGLIEKYNDKNRVRLGDTKSGVPVPIFEDYYTPQIFSSMSNFPQYDYYMPMLLFHEKNSSVDVQYEKTGVEYRLNELPEDIQQIITNVFSEYNVEMPDKFEEVLIDMELVTDVMKDKEHDEYIEAMKGDYINLTVPPVVVHRNKLIDGFKRVQASILGGSRWLRAIDLSPYIDQINNYPEFIVGISNDISGK